jgi:hypothetical protein
MKDPGVRAVKRESGGTMAPNPKTLFATGAIIIVLLPLAACSREDSGDQTANDASEVVRFVERFMKARQAGLPADEFLSGEAQTAYERHATGLWLYDDTLPGGPGGEYQRFSIAAGREGGQRSWTLEVRIQVRWVGDAPPSEMVEVLTVRPGVVVDARRTDDLTDDGLPSAVAETRQAIYRAAVTHNYKALRSLLDPETFSYSFGESGDPIGYWRKQEEAEVPLVGDILPGVLHTRYGRIEDLYVWPSAAAKEPSAWTEEDLESMRKAGSTDEEIRLFEQYGGYTGWRAGIRADGVWLSFVAGD